MEYCACLVICERLLGFCVKLIFKLINIFGLNYKIFERLYLPHYYYFFPFPVFVSVFSKQFFSISLF